MTEPHPPRTAAGPPELAPPRPGDAGEAEDLVQETFLQAHSKWHTCERRSDPATWLGTGGGGDGVGGG